MDPTHESQPIAGGEYNELDRIKNMPFMINAVPKIHTAK